MLQFGCWRASAIWLLSLALVPQNSEGWVVGTYNTRHVPIRPWASNHHQSFRHIATVSVQLKAKADPEQISNTEKENEEQNVELDVEAITDANTTATNATTTTQNTTNTTKPPSKGLPGIGDLDFLETREKTPLEGILETLIPPVAPVLAFFYYDVVADFFRWTVKQLSRNSWLNDGSRDPTTLSALNSIVVPTSAIVYATLTATTINAMRQRQQTIRVSINKEASELRILRGLIKYFPEERQDRCRFLLIRYISRVIEECQPKINLNELESRGLVSEINDFITEMNAMVAANNVLKGNRAADTQADAPMSDILIFQVYDSAMRLESCRNDRLSAMQNTFPMLHYIVLFSLAFSITIGFLIETNKTKVDSDFFQLRVIWTMMVASFSALGIVSYDLNFPFGGNYSVKLTTDQLYAIRFSLRRDYVEKERQLENLF